MKTTSMKNRPTGMHGGWRGRAGISMVEALIALVIAVVAIAGGFLVNSHELAIVRSTRESGHASGLLEERVEQLRAATWMQITDGAYLSEVYFAALPRSAAALPGHWEQIEVSRWPLKPGATPLLVEKRARSAAAVLNTAKDLPGERMAKVDVRVFWTGQGGRTRMRDATTLISNGGISRMNLPGLGTGGDGTPDPDTEPTPTHGHGQGRGNVAGKPGKN